MANINLKEVYTYKWEASKKPFHEIEAVDSFSDLPAPESVKNGTRIYVQEDRKVYRAIHKKEIKVESDR